jgi:hypothetical protein
MLMILVCISLILAYSFVFSFSNSFLYNFHAQQDPTGHVSTSYLLTKVMKRVQQFLQVIQEEDTDIGYNLV